MVNSSTYFKQISEIDSLIESLKVYSGLAESLSDFLHVKEIDDNDSVTELVPLHKEHFINLKAAAQQLSSYSDRLSSKLVTLEKTIKEIDFSD